MSTAARELPTTPASAHDAQPSLLARYGTLADVRHAINALEAQGIDGDQLALVGEGAAHLSGHTEVRRADRRFLASTTVALAVGILGGALVAAVLGAAIIGIVLLLWSGLDDKGWVFLLLTGWFAVGGAVLGGFTAISRSVGFSDAVPDTFEDEPEGPLWLAVYAHPAHVEEGLRTTHPLEIVRDPDIRTVHPTRDSATEPPVTDREPEDVPEELADAAREELATPADETDEG
jgi:hypothetical protein